MKTAIVTGASGNMGQAVVRKFLAEGYNVVGTIVPNDPAPFDIVDTKLEKVIVDLMNEEDSDKFIKTAVAKYGSIDAAVLTVGGFAMGKIADDATGQRPDIYYRLQARHECQRRQGDGSVRIGEVTDIPPGRIDE
jgi:NAD(P)-dependent dehydrogenase (short-subunit alcohol dehydrogenase family)